MMAQKNLGHFSRCFLAFENESRNFPRSSKKKKKKNYSGLTGAAPKKIISGMDFRCFFLLMRIYTVTFSNHQKQSPLVLKTIPAHTDTTPKNNFGNGFLLFFFTFKTIYCKNSLII
jgi:hypothetical protein